MKLYTKAEFSRVAGVSTASIAKAIKTGRVKVFGEGRSARVDVMDPVNMMYINGIEDHPTAGGKKSGAVPDKPTPAPPAPTQPEDLIELLDLGNLGTLSKQSADRVKTIAQIQQIRVKTEEMRKELIPRFLVQKIISKLYTIDVNEFRTLGPNLSPEIAALTSIDDSETIIKIEAIVEKEVYNILRHVKRLMNDFLKSVEAEEIVSHEEVENVKYDLEMCETMGCKKMAIGIDGEGFKCCGQCLEK
ncbi:MAG: hypothetical protein KAR42_15010 [candidate division Zixibacteria bacterium]|nr:hypothetical protein [candidate division Zixibacteria bacterium]